MKTSSSVGFADRDGFDLAGKGFHHVRNKAMTVLALKADLTIEHLCIYFEALANFVGEGTGKGAVISCAPTGMLPESVAARVPSGFVVTCGSVTLGGVPAAVVVR